MKRPRALAAFFSFTRAVLESKPQGKLHQARLVQSIQEYTEGARRCQAVIALELHLAHVKARSVGYVESLPAESEFFALQDLPRFRQTCVDIKGSRSAQVIALT